MSGTNSLNFVMLPPQTDITRDWGKRLMKAVREARVVVVEDAETAARARSSKPRRRSGGLARTF